jgi:hypothetical protein
MTDQTTGAPKPEFEETPGMAAGDEPGAGFDKAKAAVGGLLKELGTKLDDFAEKASPTVKETAAKAADLTAKAGEAAGPIAHKVAEVAGDVGHRVAEKSRTFASDLRRAGEAAADKMTGNGSASPRPAEPAAPEEPAEPSEPAKPTKPTKPTV